MGKTFNPSNFTTVKDLKKLAHTSTTNSPKCAENTCAANAAPAYAGFNRVKMSKGIRKQLVEKHIHKYM